MSAAGLTTSAKGQVFTDLYNFAGGTSDGARPQGSLTDVNGILYGMTLEGGANSHGAIISFNPATETESLLYSFAGSPNDGAVPYGSFVPSATDPSLLYGMTESGGQGSGTIISFDTSTNTESVLGAFNTAPLGNPEAGVVQSGNTLYGVAGNLFSFNLIGGSPSLLYAFEGPPDGRVGVGTPVLIGSTLYGMTEIGGSGGNGTVYSYNLSNNTETVLHSFGGKPDGSLPLGSLVQSGTLLYGMTAAGGSAGGIIFSLDITSGAYQSLLTFDGDNGGGPAGDLLVDGPIIYGMTAGGGGGGIVFAFNTLSDTETVLHSFDRSDGANPDGDLTLVGNTLYGMTQNGGANGDGVLFSITVPEPGTLTLTLVGAGGLLRRRRIVQT